SGNGPRLRPRHSQDGPSQSCTNSERLHSGRGGFAESKIQPLLQDQSLAGRFGPLRQNVRAIPRAVLAWLAAHGFQPDLVCKSHWTAGKVGVRAHGAWDHEMFARDLGWDGRFSSPSRSPWSRRRAKWPLRRAKWPLRRAKWSLRRAKWPSARIGLPMATSLSYPSDSIASHASCSIPEASSQTTRSDFA